MYKKIGSLRELLKYKYFFFDCDGVLWHGGKELFNAFKALSFLQENKKEIFLLTNNSTQSRKSGSRYIKSKFNFNIDPNRYISSAFLAGHYIESKKYSNIYSIGVQPLFDELKIALDSLKKPYKLFGLEDNSKSSLDDDFYRRINKEKVDAVVVGKDDKINYYKLASAVAYVNKGAELIETHSDLVFRSQGLRIPNTGTIVKAIEFACEKKSTDLGKPQSYGIKTICDTYKINFEQEREKMVIIGDNLGVEIALGNSIKIDSVLVLSGSTTKENLQNELEKNKRVMPKYLIPHLLFIY